MKINLKIVSILLLAAIFSCKKDKKSDPEPAPVPATGSLKLSYENMVDSVPLVFGNNYVNAHGDTFQVSKFNYYISNIVLIKSDNSTYAEPTSYHLVKHSVPGTGLITLTGVPLGSYKALSFMLGVDSARDVSGAQSGDLDPVTASDMYWGWGSGYVALKLEGSSPKSGAQDKTLTFHMGGIGGPYKPQRTFNLAFGSASANVSTSVSPLVHLAVNANRLFSPDTINFANQYEQTTIGPGVKVYADNYAGMIRFKQLSN